VLPEVKREHPARHVVIPTERPPRTFGHTVDGSDRGIRHTLRRNPRGPREHPSGVRVRFYWRRRMPRRPHPQPFPRKLRGGREPVWGVAITPCNTIACHPGGPGAPCLPAAHSSRAEGSSLSHVQARARQQSPVQRPRRQSVSNWAGACRGGGGGGGGGARTNDRHEQPLPPNLGEGRRTSRGTSERTAGERASRRSRECRAHQYPRTALSALIRPYPCSEWRLG
jgi:hypothetical protein